MLARSRRREMARWTTTSSGRTLSRTPTGYARARRSTPAVTQTAPAADSSTADPSHHRTPPPQREHSPYSRCASAATSSTSGQPSPAPRQGAPPAAWQAACCAGHAQAQSQEQSRSPRTRRPPLPQPVRDSRTVTPDGSRPDRIRRPARPSMGPRSRSAVLAVIAPEASASCSLGRRSRRAGVDWPCSASGSSIARPMTSRPLPTPVSRVDAQPDSRRGVNESQRKKRGDRHRPLTRGRSTVRRPRNRRVNEQTCACDPGDQSLDRTRREE